MNETLNTILLGTIGSIIATLIGKGYVKARKLFREHKARADILIKSYALLLESLTTLQSLRDYREDLNGLMNTFRYEAIRARQIMMITLVIFASLVITNNISKPNNVIGLGIVVFTILTLFVVLAGMYFSEHYDGLAQRLDLQREKCTQTLRERVLVGKPESNISEKATKELTDKPLSELQKRDGLKVFIQDGYDVLKEWTDKRMPLPIPRSNQWVADSLAFVAKHFSVTAYDNVNNHHASLATTIQLSLDLSEAIKNTDDYEVAANVLRKIQGLEILRDGIK